jgi:outer membrane protein
VPLYFLGGLTLLWVVPAAAAAPPVKVGWIDLQRTLLETRVGKSAKGKLEAEKDLKQKQINDRKEKLQKAAEDLDKQKDIMKPEAVANRQRELQEEYVQLQQLFVQLQQDLAKSEANLTKEIFIQASSIIENIATRDGYTMIIEKNEGAVLWADKSFDITDEVNKRLDAGEGKKPEAAPAATPAKPPAKKPAEGKK